MAVDPALRRRGGPAGRRWNGPRGGGRGLGRGIGADPGRAGRRAAGGARRGRARRGSANRAHPGRGRAGAARGALDRGRGRSAPSLVAEVPPGLLLGVVLAGGSPTAHVAILARSLGIPAVVAAAGLLDAVPGANGHPGHPGRQRHMPSARSSPSTARRVRFWWTPARMISSGWPGCEAARAERDRHAAALRGRPAATRDGQRVLAPGQHSQPRRCRSGDRCRGGGRRSLPDRVPLHAPPVGPDRGRADGRLPSGDGGLRSRSTGRHSARRHRRRQGDPVPGPARRTQPVPRRPGDPPRARFAGAAADAAAGDLASGRPGRGHAPRHGRDGLDHRRRAAAPRAPRRGPDARWWRPATRARIGWSPGS